MPARGRRVSFVIDREDAPEIYIRRTRGSSQGRSRSRSAERVHTILDDFETMQGRERVVGRDAYDQLLRENQFLRIEKREKDNELQRSLAYNQQLERENEELRRSTGTSTDADSRKAKLKEARKKNARLEVDVDNLKDQVSQWRRLYEEAIRRIDIMRENLNSHIEEEARLERENATLKRSARRHGF